MSVEENKELVRRYVEEGAIQVLQGNPDAIHEYLAPDYVNHHPPIHDSDAQGVQAMKDNFTEAGKAIPDLRSTADLLIGEGDLVAAHWTARGTHSGTMQHRHADDLPASGQEFTSSGVFVCRVAGGKIVESWSYDNHLDGLISAGMLQVSPGANT